MQCPQCFQTIKYKERNYNKCPKCSAYFAFEPKVHPLKLTDIYFSKVVDKLSDNGKLFFTKEQLHFAVSRKKIKSNSKVLWLIIPAIITTIIAFVISGNILSNLYRDDLFGRVLAVLIPGFVFFIWIVIMISLKIFRKTHVSLPQTLAEFESDVIYTWKGVHKGFPAKMISQKPHSNYSNVNLRGILFCQTEDTADFLVANQVNTKLGLAVYTEPSSNPNQNRADLPIYVLHDASGGGYAFLEKIKNHFGNQRKVIDIGLHPQSVMKSKLIKFRKKNHQNNNFSSLKPEEVNWLNKGYYTPLFVLRPAQLIQYVSKQIEQRRKQIIVDNPEKQAQAIGFMTWAGEK